MSSTTPTPPRNSKLTARITNDTYVQLVNLSKTTGEPVSKVASDIIAKGLRSNG
jgi:predicted DNA-binding protein